MKIIFLDWDGVVCGHSMKNSIIDRGKYRIALGNIPAVNELMQFCYENDIKIVVNSTINAFGDSLVRFAMRDIIGVFYLKEVYRDITQYARHGKGVMADMYINQQSECIRYLIIDDEPEKYLSKQQSRIVKCNRDTGITSELVAEVKRKWNID